MSGRLARLAAAVPLALGLAANVATGPQPAGREVPDHGAAVVMRNAVLWSGPSANARRDGAVEEGDVVFVLTRRSGYARVQTQEDGIGWVTERRLRSIDESEVHEPAAMPAAAPAAMAAAPRATRVALHVAGGDFNGCPPEGKPSPRGSNYQQLLALNRQKNRSSEPTDADVDRTVTLVKLLEPSDNDSQRWSSAKAAEIVGFVFHVKPGAQETVNCKNPESGTFDSHIELVTGADATGPTRRFIVEVTPRWRAAMAAQNVDWSTKTLQQTIQGRCVKVRGWLFFDAEHWSQSENTKPGNPRNFRATAWEIHPVSSLAVVPCPS